MISRLRNNGRRLGSGKRGYIPAPLENCTFTLVSVNACLIHVRYAVVRDFMLAAGCVLLYLMSVLLIRLERGCVFGS
jgi:hypothetical protein